jgi:hypothetical protein
LAETPLPSLPDLLALSVEPPKVQLAKVVGRQLLDSFSQSTVVDGTKPSTICTSPVQLGPCLSISRLESTSTWQFKGAILIFSKGG